MNTKQIFSAYSQITGRKFAVCKEGEMFAAKIVYSDGDVLTVGVLKTFTDAISTLMDYGLNFATNEICTLEVFFGSKQ